MNMLKKFSMFVIIMTISITFAGAHGIWFLKNSFTTDTSIADQQFMFLAADSAGNLFASCYNSSPTTANVNFYKVSNWVNGIPTFLAFDITTGMPSGRSEYGIWVDKSGNVYGSMDNGDAASSFYKVWNSSLVPVTTVYNPSSGRPTGLVVDEDVSNPKGRHLYHGDLVNGKIRVRNMSDQSIAGGYTWDQLKPGVYPRDLALQPIAGTDTAYNLWVNFNGSVLVFPNVSGRTIEADTADLLRYSAITVVTNPAPAIINDLGIAYDSVRNTIIYGAGNDSTAGFGETMRVITADTTGTELQVLGTPGVPGNDDTHFDSPADAVTVDLGGHHYLAVTDVGNYRIMVYQFGIPVTPNSPVTLNPGQSVNVTADTTVANGTITWTMSTAGLGTLSSSSGASITFTATNANIAGSLTITATDSDGDTGTTALITLTATSAPLVQESSYHGAVRSEPMWNFME